MRNVKCSERVAQFRFRTVQKDHKGHKDRRILTEANEGFSNAKENPADKPSLAFVRILLSLCPL